VRRIDSQVRQALFTVFVTLAACFLHHTTGTNNLTRKCSQTVPTISLRLRGL